MTDKKEAVLLKINQINVELDSLMAWGEFVLVLMSFADKFQPSRKSGNETIHVLCLEALSDGARKINWVRFPTGLFSLMRKENPPRECGYMPKSWRFAHL
ncbi:hypothetical protein BHL85_07675 [Limosilactobacillus reuteri]|uniref:hypothetical protein n=1 Tax=Limosilactobacillus reuteri TaxID=1598 RepID=UPI000A2D1357|nr:hypothetical protein [Limosilactobacillus reuteri]OTA44042.1 hypothetical protein BHL85_07675 [Limosilactobacillus reuteri]OTA46146.1 hypothetical protein BHL74_00540 [Limosilactobacillus reuteri]OTA80159.1 hypothetical protein BHL79_09270 [Limosilactobacillus reuteri]